jgi:putative addiction module killer protein
MVTNVLPLEKYVASRKVVEYLSKGSSLFGAWFSGLDPHAAAKVTVALYRLEQGNVSNVKAVGKGVSEYKIDFGPGYRIYFGQEGNELVILLGGGSKKTQEKDIKTAHMLWAEYKLIKARKK